MSLRFLRPILVSGGARQAAAAGVALALSGPGAWAQAPTLEHMDAAAGSAVVLMYHRFGEARYPATSIRIDQFEAHIRELTSSAYRVLALPEVVAALRDGRRLPDRTVAITVDDAFTSVYREAWPRLRAANLPFTLFVATGQIAERPGGEYMTWDQVREMAKAGVTIANHSVTHARLPELGNRRIAEELEMSSAMLQKELGVRPTIHAYPYGEASTHVLAAARKAGFVAAFGQHSGVLHPKSNMDYLPRFALNETYGSIERFRLAVNALPLYATDISPSDPTLQRNPPPFGFTVPEGVPPGNLLACYSSQHGKLAIERLGARRIEVRLPSALRAGRARINCTLPARGGRWRWFGYQYYVPKSLALR
ncbi:MAG: polysaccharide deacetylase family protein [Alphaproteobacteria bacterium]|nr:polysaccharide deacetylase family protein [Alphaproteobacteria bacterium]